MQLISPRFVLHRGDNYFPVRQILIIMFYNKIINKDLFAVSFSLDNNIIICCFFFLVYWYRYYYIGEVQFINIPIL